MTVRRSRKHTPRGARSEGPSPPPPSAFLPREWKLIQRLRTPEAVQRFLHRLSYNREEKGETQRSFREVVRRGKAHCMEAALAAAVILEQHGYPPLVLSFDSQDNLDHIVFVFRRRGRWGAVARSRDAGLHGRRPVFRSLRDLAWSYYDPYVDLTGRLKGYQLVDLRALDGYDWRFSPRNMWKVEKFLVYVPHRPMRSSDRRYRRLLRAYRAFRSRHPKAPAAYYRGRERWM